MYAAATTEFQVRVTFSMGVTARTPPVSPATGIASAPSSSSSAVGSLRVPSFSLSRFTRRPFGAPSAVRVSR